MRKFFSDKKLIINVVVSFITIVVALVNIFIFSERFGNKENKAKAIGNNYYVTYTAILSPGSRNLAVPGDPGGARISVNYITPKIYAWDISIREVSPTGTEIAHEFWIAANFYYPPASAKGSELSCNEALWTFSGNGRIYDANLNQDIGFTWVNSVLGLDDAQLLQKITNDLQVRYHVSNIRCADSGGGSGPLWLSDDWGNFPRGPFFYGGCETGQCGNLDRGVDAFNAILRSHYIPSAWIIMGRFK